MNAATGDPVYFLLVDDLDENLQALEALLRRPGLVQLKARSGVEALELLLRHEVALALVDVQMPGMDGFELAELMRGTERTRRVPIIFVTAGTADRDRRFRGYEAGAVDFLQKPIEPDILQSKADVFFELYRQRQEVARQRDELGAANEEKASLLEETRTYAEALREADQRKDEFLATLAHELRNPLAPIRNALQLLKISPPGSPPAVEARDIMERQVVHMVRLVDDLLDVSRVSTGKIELKREIVGLRSVVESAVEASMPLIESAGHRLGVHLPPEPLTFHADPTRLAQVVGNLLNNAAKYTPPGGAIELVAERDGDYAIVRIRDSGVGIAKEMLPAVFELFRQVGRSLDLSQGGLGIGLSIVQRLVTMHGGNITAESEGLGRGSTFTIRLPLAQTSLPDARPSGAVERSRPVPLALRILVVDDNEDGADSLAKMLELSGHIVSVAGDGPAALSKAREFHPEVVFLDIGLPGMSGYEVAEQLRSDTRLSSTVLVALTGWGSADDKRRAKEAGFDHHMTKPVDPEALDELLSTVEPASRVRLPEGLF